jgi:phage baseplate assembly protein gpV
MPYSVKNIIVGAAALFISQIDSTDAGFYPSGQPAGVPVPTLTSGQPAAPKFEADATNWRNMGYTTDGVEVSYEPDFGEVQVDQMLDSAKLFKQGMRVSINTTLVEASLENLLVAWGQSSDTLSGGVLTLSGGALGDEPVERSLAFVGGAPRSATGVKSERLYYVRRALQVETSAHSLTRSDATTFPVSFRLLAEATVSGSDYGTITERTLS